MADIATIWNADLGVGDWQLLPASLLVWTDGQGNSIVDEAGQAVSAIFTASPGLVDGQDLYTAVLISLFTDAEASDDDDIPDGSGNPRGWWGGPIGSKLWLLARSKATADIPARAKGYIADALQWLLDDEIVAAVEIVTEWTRPNLLGARIVLRRRDGARAALSFTRLWESA